MMRRLLINSFSFAVGVLLAAAMLLPAYASAGPVQLKGQSGISNSKFGFGGANPTTTYTVGQTTIRDVTATGTDVTVFRETPFEGRNKFGSKATGKIIDAFKVPKEPLVGTLKGLFRGGLVGIGGSILAGYAIDQGWKLLTELQCQASLSCYGKDKYFDAPYSASYDVAVSAISRWQNGTVGLNPWQSMGVFPNTTACNFSDSSSIRVSCSASQLTQLDAWCKQLGYIGSSSYMGASYVGYCYQTGTGPLGVFRAYRTGSATASQPRPLTPVADADYEKLARDILNSVNPTTPYEDQLKVIRELADNNIPVEATNENTTALAAPMQTPERTLSTTTTANPDGSVDTNTSKGKTMWTISPTGEITMKDVITETQSHTTPEGQTTTGPTTSTETPNQIDPDTPPADQPVLPADPAMPTVPELYKQKYKDGLKGVWDAKKQGFMNTEFIQSIKSLAPEGLDSGSCPQWSLGFDMGVANYGEQSLPFPCWLAPFLKAVMMLTAAFTARKIIWG